MKLFAYVPGTRAWARRRDLKICKQTGERIQEIVDGEIEHAQAAEVLKVHLEACHRCHVEAELIRDLKKAICRVSGEADPELVGSLENLARRLCEGAELPPE